MASSLDEEVGKWLTRPLHKTYPYLVVDARYEKVREAGRVVSKGVLVAVGIDSDGYREILGVYVADSESETSWGEMFEELKMRGLSGVQLIVSDQHSGLMNAIRRYFDGAVWQRCTVHYVRNFKNKLSPNQMSRFSPMLKKIWEEESVEDARRKASELISALERVRPDVAEWIEETIDDTLAIYAFPARHRRKLKSTNMLERVNQELKRRTLVVRIFPNVRACLRMCGTL